LDVAQPEFGLHQISGNGDIYTIEVGNGADDEHPADQQATEFAVSTNSLGQLSEGCVIAYLALG
jgi:hypothetical protein